MIFSVKITHPYIHRRRRIPVWVVMQDDVIIGRELCMLDALKLRNLVQVVVKHTQYA